MAKTYGRKNVSDEDSDNDDDDDENNSNESIRDDIVGVYMLHPNKPGRCSHIGHSAYMVCKSARGHGVGKAMGLHSIAKARERRFRGIQFNMVVSTNIAAVNLWKKLGFEIVGRLPKAFRHAMKGYVDGLIMFLNLIRSDDNDEENSNSSMLLLRLQEEEDIAENDSGTVMAPAFRVEKSMLQFENINL